MKLKIALTLALLLSVGIATFAYVTPQEAEQIAAEQELLAQEGYDQPVIEEDEPMVYEGYGYAPDYIYNRGYRGPVRGPRVIERRH